MAQYSDMPNWHDAVQTNIPVISSILTGFLGGLFVTVATSESPSLVNPVTASVFGWCPIQLPISQAGLVMILSGIAALLFLNSVIYSMRSQASDYEAIPVDRRIGRPPQSLRDFWETNTERFADISLSIFNMGIAITPFTVLPFVPPSVIPVFLLVVIGYELFAFFFKRRLPTS